MAGKPQKHPWWYSFKWAFRGAFYTFKTQKHMKFHLVAAILVILAAFILEVEPWQWAVLFLTIGSVITAEAFNTAIELVLDLTHPQYHPLAGLAKDVAAGAVLLSSIIAVIIGVIIFGPYLLRATGTG